MPDDRVVAQHRVARLHQVAYAERGQRRRNERPDERDLPAGPGEGRRDHREHDEGESGKTGESRHRNSCTRTRRAMVIGNRPDDATTPEHPSVNPIRAAKHEE